MSGEKIQDRLPPTKEELRDEPLIQVVRVYQYFLRELFGALPRGRYHWSDDDLTEIWLCDQGPVSSQILDVKPSVVSIRGDFRYSSLTLDQRKSLDPRTDDREHQDLLTGTMTFQCIAKDGLEATRLATIVARGIMRFRREIAVLGNCHEVSAAISIGTESPAGAYVEGNSDYEFVAVPVQSPVHLRESWSIGALNQDVLRSIESRLRAQLELSLSPEQKRRAVRGPSFQGSPLRVIDELDLVVKT